MTTKIQIKTKASFSIISLNQAQSDRRLDAEYYDPEYLRIIKILKDKKSQKVKDAFKIKVFSGPFGSFFKSENYLSEGHPFIRISDISDFFLDKEKMVFVCDDDFVKLKKYQLSIGDIVFSKIGTVGRLSIITEEIGKVAISENNIGLAFQTIIDQIDKAYIAFFLLSDFGQKQIFRLASGNVQLKLNVSDIENILIPQASIEIKKSLKNTLEIVHEKLLQSQKSYKEAVQLLMRNINLGEYKTSNKNTSTRLLSDCLAGNRFDAEYWLPDFDVIIAKVSKYKNGVSTIGDEFKQLKGNFKSEKGIDYNYVEIGDVNVSSGEIGHNLVTSAELPANAKIKLGKKQLITSKVRPNRGATAILDNHEGYIASGAFTVLVEEDNINLETLMVYLKAKPIRELLLRYNTGTSYPVITDTDVLKLPIPLLDKALQKKISELVNISANERREAKQLLEKSKRAVEIFIEQDEKAALQILNLTN